MLLPDLKVSMNQYPVWDRIVVLIICTPAVVDMAVVLDTCIAVAVAELPVQLPDDPEQLPVTLPVNGPEKLDAVTSPVDGVTVGPAYLTPPAEPLEATPLSNIGMAVVVAVSDVCVTLTSVLGFAGIVTCKFVLPTVPTVEVSPHDSVGLLSVTD